MHIKCKTDHNPTSYSYSYEATDGSRYRPVDKHKDFQIYKVIKVEALPFSHSTQK